MYIEQFVTKSHCAVRVSHTSIISYTSDCFSLSLYVSLATTHIAGAEFFSRTALYACNALCVCVREYTFSFFRSHNGCRFPCTQPYGYSDAAAGEERKRKTFFSYRVPKKPNICTSLTLFL